MLGRFLFYFFFLFVWVPSLIIRFYKEDSTTLDKLFISLTHSTLFFMIAIHILVGIRLLETFSLLLLSVVCLIVVLRFRSRSTTKPFYIKLFTLLDLLDNRTAIINSSKLWFSNVSNKILSKVNLLIQIAMKYPILIFSYLLVFGVAMVDRFNYSFTHLSFSSSDSYVHLGWSKYLAHMQIYLDGVYPFGFESIIASLYKVFQLDMYITVRFMGALTALLMMLSLVYSLRKIIGRDYSTILLTAFLLFYSSAMRMGNDVILWRQLSALSMEFSSIFLFPGITFFYLYFKNNKRYYLLFAAECYAITAFTHPFVTVTMTFAFLAIGIAHLDLLFKNNNFLRIIFYMGVAGFIGILPPIIGLLAGKSFHGSSINYAKGELLSNKESIHVVEALTSWFSNQPMILIMYICFILYFVIWCVSKWLIKRNPQWTLSDQSPLIMAAIFLFIMILSFLSSEIGLPTLVPIDRQPVFLSMSASLFFGILWGFVKKHLKRRNLQWSFQCFGWSAILLFVLLVPGQRMDFPPGDQHQYDEAMRGYLDIKKNYPLKHWVIISPVDELGVIYGYGYHYELWEFVRDLADSEVKQLTFTTPYAFLFIEKVPIDIINNEVRSITREDAEMPFPVANTPNLTEFYYGFGYQNRRILQAKAYYWAEEYIKTHKDMEVFLDTPNMKIYKIYQGKDKVILKK